MADSRESLPNNDLTEDDIAKLTQQIPATDITGTASIKQTDSTQKRLNAIGSESEQSKLTGSKSGTTQIPSTIQSNKLPKNDSNQTSENILQENINITPDLICSITCSAQGNDDNITDIKHDNIIDTEHQVLPQRIKSSCNETFDSTISSALDDLLPLVNTKTDNSAQEKSENQNENPEKSQANAEKLTEMMPESMYSVLQQRAQNVLKMIADKKVSENAVPFHSKEQYPDNQSNIQSPTTEKHSTELKKSVESTNSKSSKTSDHSTKDLSDKKSSNKVNEKSDSPSFQPNENKSEFSPFNVFQCKVPSKLLEQKSQTDHNICHTDSQQSARSTEQCTTDYSIKNKSDSITGQNIDFDKKLIENETKLSVEKVDPEKVNETLQQVFSEHSTQEVIKELSQIIHSNDVPNKLTKRGEIICYLFKQKLLSNLEAAGKLDTKSSELVNVTATKFAKWMEDILKEIDIRKKKTSTDAKILKDDVEEDEFISASSSKESLSHKENLKHHDIVDEKPEVVKIQEISDCELTEKYGNYLKDETKHETFHFVGPDERPVEVNHLLVTDSNAKVMIVKKKITDSQSTTWVVEVGPEVKIENTSGSVSKDVIKEVYDKENVTLKQGEWNLEKIGWENWLPKVLAQTKTNRRKIPILKKQCIMRESDYDIQYPTYSPSLLALGTMDRSVFDGNNIMLPTPPQAEPSAPQDQ